MEDSLQVGPLWRISVDTGGTFTDALGRSSDGEERRAKVLSSGVIRLTCLGRGVAGRIRIQPTTIAVAHLFGGAVLSLGERVVGTIRDDNLPEGWIELVDGGEALGWLKDGDVLTLSTGEEAPVVAARLLTGTPLGVELPVEELRVGTTRGTNALLENKGAKVGLIVAKGFADLLRIRDQRRPDLFARVAVQESGLDPLVWEIEGRLDASGREIAALDVSSIQRIILEAKAAGCEAMAVSLLNSYQNSEHEDAILEELSKAGFLYAVGSTALRPFIHYLHRSETAVVDATLGPVLKDYLDGIEACLDGRPVQVMTSSGTILPRSRFRAMESLLSGPAGGVAGAAAEARRVDLEQAITFDMGGTSTDVARWAGDFDYQNEQSVGRAKILSRSVRIETVAAGGGSICRVEKGRLLVGPESAGSMPGPACYGAGGPLALTDVNLLLGRLDPKTLSIPLRVDAAERAARVELAKMPSGTRLEELLHGWVAVANLRMAQTIREISVGQGFDPGDHTLIAFGGAGGMHACGVSELLGMDSILIPRDAGLLSAVGISETHSEARVERQLIKGLAAVGGDLVELRDELAEEGYRILVDEGISDADIVHLEKTLDLRLRGQESTLMVEWLETETEIEDAFRERFVSIFGYAPHDMEIEVVAARVRLGLGSSDSTKETFRPLPQGLCLDPQANAKPIVYLRESLSDESLVRGPALITDAFSTTFVEAGWVCRLGSQRSLSIEKFADGALIPGEPMGLVRTELLLHRCYGVVGEMGEQLRRTGLSANIRERLDFSCALLDSSGRLIVSAPHIPVHLGALGPCARAVMETLPLRPGDVVMTNHPGYGGSHLPDITLISGVFHEGELIAVLANRAHHAELGGMRPGSMPADAKRLVEEGVVIEPFRLCEGETVHWDFVKALLREAPYPSRSPEENLADLHAQLAALRVGESQVTELISSQGVVEVQDFFSGEIERADALMGRVLAGLPDFSREVRDTFDDGSPLQVTVAKTGEGLSVDFSGSSPIHRGNLNGTPAIVRSALLYCLRLLVDETLPLNEGLLQRVELVVPEGILNPDFSGAAETLPAVVGGNVETSQRLVDILLEAFEISANGPGTMNNLLFGNERFGYYETIGGGAGAAEGHAGGSGLHLHMTNTAITDPEVLEQRFPVRLWGFSLRTHSGGVGRWNGGNGLERVFEWLEPLSVSVLTQRRVCGPRGLSGGGDGLTGEQALRAPDSEEWMPLPGTVSWDAKLGERLRIRTPGGGAWGCDLKS